MDTQEWPAQRFEEHRTHPHAVAYRTPVISGGDEAWYRLNVAGRVTWRFRRGLFWGLSRAFRLGCRGWSASVDRPFDRRSCEQAVARGDAGQARAQHAWLVQVDACRGYHLRGQLTLVGGVREAWEAARAHASGE